jgi:hypothetical protein
VIGFDKCGRKVAERSIGEHPPNVVRVGWQAASGAASRGRPAHKCTVEGTRTRL